MALNELMHRYRECRKRKLCVACKYWTHSSFVRGVCHEPDTQNRKWSTSAEEPCFLKPKKFLASQNRFSANYEKIMNAISHKRLDISK
jgi:hypothetical protein